PTASSHLARLLEGGLVTVTAQGRHRYYGLSSSQVAAMLEAIMGVAAAAGPRRVRPGPRDTALRRARICYDHLAGDAGVALYDRLTGGGMLRESPGEALQLTHSGTIFFRRWGLDPAALQRGRRALCRSCLDWSVRRSHLGGALGAAVL